jgi:hypothetical protein
MAKRFTDSTKWNDVWFSNLTDKEKLTWIYILDTCSHAGIWEKNLKVLNFHIGSTFVEGELNKIFAGKFIELRDKWFIPNYIKFQYGDKFLISNNNAITSAKKSLIELGFIIKESNGNLTLSQGLPNPYITINQPLTTSCEALKEEEQEQDKVQNKVEDKVQNKVEDKVQVENNDKLKYKYELKEKLIGIFKDIPDIRKLMDNQDFDTIERRDKYLFSVNFATISEYQKIKI